MKCSTKILIVALFTVLANTGWAQCRTFVKNNCREQMSGYIPGESFNAARLMPGDQAEMSLTFYPGQDYRLLVCAHPILGAVEFQVIDGEKNEIFDNIKNDLSDHFDFRVAGTQNLTVKLRVPAGKGGSINPQGCVAVLVGKKVE